MYKKLRVLLILFIIFGIDLSYSLEIPSSTENSGMNKYERINKIEQDLIKLAREVEMLKIELSTMKISIKNEVLKELKDKGKP